MKDPAIATNATLEELLRLTKEIIEEKEAAYGLLEPKHSLDAIEDRDAFILSYAGKIRAFENRVREHNYVYTCRLILNHYKSGFYYDDEQLELLFMLIDGQRLSKHATEANDNLKQLSTLLNAKENQHAN